MSQDKKNNLSGPGFGSSGFDPFNAEHYYDEGERELEQYDPGWAKAALFFRTGQHFGHADGSQRARSLIRIRELIEVYHTRFQAGDTLALLHAVGICAEENLPLPTWLATAYLAAFTAFLQVGGPASLDSVFNSPNLPTTTFKKAATARQDWALGTELYRAAWELALADTSISSLQAVATTLLEQGRRDESGRSVQWGVAIGKAKKLIEMIDTNQRELLSKPKSQALSAILEKRRKL